MKTNKIYLVILLMFLSGAYYSQACDSLLESNAETVGPYNVATLVESDGLRDGPDYNGSTIYYPTNATPPFVSIIIVPGYWSYESSIQEWGPFLASHGIITMTIGTNSIFDYPDLRANALLDAKITLQEENVRANSPLVGKINTAIIAVGGWSMGGGGAQLAAMADPSLKAVIGLCPWLDDTQITSNSLNHSIPIAIISGEADGTAPPVDHANVHYSYTPSGTDKLLYEVTNGDHLVANYPASGGGEVGKIVLSWLKYFLVEDDCYCQLLQDPPSSSSNFMTNVTCPTTGIDNQSNAVDYILKVYPNPAKERINLITDNSITDYQIFSVSGVKILEGRTSEGKNSIEIRNLSAGVYFLKIRNEEYSRSIRFIVE